MKILLLEDEPERIKKVKYATIGHHMDIATTAKGTIHLLSTLRAYEAYDIISLDHDLGGEIMTPSNENSGFAVAKQAAELLPILWPRAVIVHSFNPIGATNMIKTLEKTHLIKLTSGPIEIIRALFNTPKYWKAMKLNN